MRPPAHHAPARAQPPPPAAEATGYHCKAPLGLPPQVAAAQPVRGPEGQRSEARGPEVIGQRSEVRGQRSEVSGKPQAPPPKNCVQASLRLGGLTANLGFQVQSLLVEGCASLRAPRAPGPHAPARSFPFARRGGSHPRTALRSQSPAPPPKNCVPVSLRLGGLTART